MFLNEFIVCLDWRRNEKSIIKYNKFSPKLIYFQQTLLSFLYSPSFPGLLILLSLYLFPCFYAEFFKQFVYFNVDIFPSVPYFTNCRWPRRHVHNVDQKKEDTFIIKNTTESHLNRALLFLFDFEVWMNANNVILTKYDVLKSHWTAEIGPMRVSPASGIASKLAIWVRN